MTDPQKQKTVPVEAPKPGVKKYGERTMGMMIQNALAQAGLMRKSGTSKSTEYFEALVDTKVKTTSRRLKRIIAVVIIVLIVVGSVFGYYVYRNRSVQIYQTTQVNYGDAAGATIAAANRYNIFMLAGVPVKDGQTTGGLQGFCTGFAVTADLLATNAHCIEKAKKRFTRISALMNGAPANRYAVVSMVAHPSYRDGRISPDVGLVRIQGRLTTAVALAPTAELGQVTPGTLMFLYGFPGRLNREDAPEATFVKGEIGRVTTFDQQLGNFGQNTLLQHSAFTSVGTSGSPMFNSQGRVIGVNAGGYIENGEALRGYNFGMRADLLNQLFPMIEVR